MSTIKTVDSKCFPLKQLFLEKFTVDFYQREYVWEKKQLEDLLNDLANAFLKCWKPSHKTENVRSYDPYFMGEVVLSVKGNSRSAVIDGQQRITTFTLILIYMLHHFKEVPGFPVSQIQRSIYDDDFGTPKFNLDIDIRRPCMLGLFKNGYYEPTEKDKMHVQKIVDRYEDISECWDERINENNVACFAYWILEQIVFSKVWANNDDFAYVIFETMNDRGLSLTQVEMLRSYLLANISSETDSATGVSPRDLTLSKFDETVNMLTGIKLSSKSKAEFEFFRVFFRGHYAEDMTKGKDTSDFVKIGKAFHRWVRENEKSLQLNSSEDYVDFVDKINYFAKQYKFIHKCIEERDTNKHLYLIVNNDYGFTLQPALILSSIAYKDSEEIVNEKIDIVSKYLTKLLTWRTWNHWRIAQSSLEQPIYELCKQIRNSNIEDLKEALSKDPIEIPDLNGSPTLNIQNKSKLRVMLALITEIVARESKVPDYMLNKDSIEVEHIRSDHYDQHLDEFDNEQEFADTRNNIGDLLVLPKTFNTSYGDDPYESKVEQYFSQNILAQTLHKNMYINHPEFKRFIERSNLKFTSYEHFMKLNIAERANLYKEILKWNWNN